MAKQNFNLDQVLMEFPDKSTLTIGQAVEGIQIFGGIGSSKTSGSTRTFALKYLQAGMGGLVTTVKTDEKQQWIKYCEEAGRSKDLVILEPGNGQHFNFLEYETRVKDRTYSTNVVSILNTIIRAGRNEESDNGDDAFWREALTLTISNVVDLCLLAYEKVTVQMLYDVFLSAPKKEDDKNGDNPLSAFSKAFTIAQKKVNSLIEAWENTMPEGWLDRMEELGLADGARAKAVPISRKLVSVYSFFMEKYKSLADKTKAIIDFKFMGSLYRLLQEPIYSMFCEGDSTVTPEDCLQGKIILLNLPVKLYDQVGKEAQIMFKYIWQRAMERRDISQNGRPVFLISDESQYLLVGNDTLFQTTCRSSRIATIYITQNISNYYAHMGGTGSEHHVKSFLGTLATKIFHANADIDTNRYASDLIGEEWMEDKSHTIQMLDKIGISKTKSEKLQKNVRPEEFVCLLTGGAKNKFMTSAYIHRQGNAFNNGKNFQRIAFNQNFHL